VCDAAQTGITDAPRVGDGKVFTGWAGMSLLETSSGKLWAGAYSALSELLPGPPEKSRAFRPYTMANGLSGLEIYSITEDRNRNLWTASAEGAMKITQSNFLTFTAADGLTPRTKAPSSVQISSIFLDRSGTLGVTTGGRVPTPFLSRLEGERRLCASTELAVSQSWPYSHPLPPPRPATPSIKSMFLTSQPPKKRLRRC
jgi:ligand-binding sensor domain-containing protein